MASANSGATESTLICAYQLLLGECNAVRYHDTGDRSGLDVRNRRAAEQSVGGGHVDLSSPGGVQEPGRPADGARRTDQIIKHQRHASFDGAADNVFLSCLDGISATFVHDRQFAPQTFGMPAGTLDTPLIRTDDHNLVVGQPELDEMFVQHRRRIEMVDRHVKEALNLSGVKIHGQHPIRSSPRNQVGDQLGGDRRSPLVLAILSCVSKIRNNGSNAIRTGPFAAVDHNQQLHQMVIDGWASRLDQIDISSPDILFNLAEILTVGEFSQ